MSMSFGEKLKIYRDAFDISQEELSQRVGTSKQVISRYESEVRDPKISTANSYANALGIPLPFLIDPEFRFSVWEHPSLIEDYLNAPIEQKLHLVKERGLDPRLIADYKEIYDLYGEKSAAQADGGQIPGYALLNEKNRALVDSLIEQLLDGQSRS